MLGNTLLQWGTEEQKRHWLPRMASGEFRGGIGLTEANAGSDLQAIRTVAKREGDDYVVNGSKMWITNSLHGQGILLLVKTDPKAEPRHKGMSLLIAPKGEGFKVSKLKKLGYRSIDSCEVHLQDYRVPASHLLGGVEGKGFGTAMKVLDKGRIHIAAVAVQIKAAISFGGRPSIVLCRRLLVQRLVLGRSNKEAHREYLDDLPDWHPVMFVKVFYRPRYFLLVVHSKDT
jgi:alkylation response protein AidB-like acyl-CoA dehydrogenase